MLLGIESVYYNLLKEKDVASFGVGMDGNIGYTLEAFRREIGFDALLPTTSEEMKVEIFRALVGSYSNLCG